MFAKIVLPSSATGLGTLFGIREAKCHFRYSFPSTNAGNATIALPSGLAATTEAVTASPGTSSEFANDNPNSIQVSGTITDYIVLEWYYD